MQFTTQLPVPVLYGLLAQIPHELIFFQTALTTEFQKWKNTFSIALSRNCPQHQIAEHSTPFKNLPIFWLKEIQADQFENYDWAYHNSTGASFWGLAGADVSGRHLLYLDVIFQKPSGERATNAQP